jgi:hypothetical protein
VSSPTCAQCGSLVSSTGCRSRIGDWFCEKRCRRAYTRIRVEINNVPSSITNFAAELPSRTVPVWDVYTQEDGTAAVCLGGTRTYNQAKEAADSHNA